MDTLVVVPARGGSKGLPGKNLLTLGGISLVGRAVRTGLAFLRQAKLPGTVLVDTDSPVIASEGRRWGAEVPFLRPAELAGDDVPMAANVLRAVDRLAAGGADYARVVLLQPTSPLRTVQDVHACDASYKRSPGSSVAVVACEHPPEQTLRRRNDGLVSWAWPELGPSGRRQDFPPSFRPSGSVYVTSVTFLREHRTFVVSDLSASALVAPESAIDVDSAADLEVARALFARRARAVAPWNADGVAGAIIVDDVVLIEGTRLPLHRPGDAKPGCAIVVKDELLPAVLDAIDLASPALLISKALPTAALLHGATGTPVGLWSDDLAAQGCAIAMGLSVAVTAPAVLARLRSLMVSPGSTPV